jgi:DNA-directed RNA polymerase specialized sigma24 family protein
MTFLRPPDKQTKLGGRKKMKTNAHNVDFNKVVADYKAGIIDFNQFYNTFYVEKRRFMSVVAQGKPEYEAVFDDTLMELADEWQEEGNNSFVGLLRVRLNSRVKDYYRAEAKKKYYEHQHVEQYARFTNSPQLAHEVEFFDFLNGLEPVLKQACELLDAGYTMGEAAKHLGFKDQRTLKKELQSAFSELLDRRSNQDVPSTKVCTKCNKEKSISEFGKNSRQKDGLHYWCKDCNNEHLRERRRKNKQ